MQETELEQKILDYIKTLYKAEYVGYLKVELLTCGYSLALGIPSYMCKTTIASDITDPEQFLNYIYEELRVRNYMKLDIYKVYRYSDKREE